MKIKKAIIPVAGKGTRFLPATKTIPKEMIPLINVPMIFYVVEEAVKAGIEEIVFITSKGKEAIEHFFQKNTELEEFLADKGKQDLLGSYNSISDKIVIKTVEQTEQLGLGHAVLQAESFIEPGESFAVLLGDDLVLSDSPVTAQLAKISSENNGCSVIGVMEVPNKDTKKYGIVKGEFLKDKKTLVMDSMVEKPSPEVAPTNLATPGRYILNSQIFNCLKEIPRGAGGEYQLTDAINLLCQKEKVFAHIFEGDRFDTGNPRAYLAATLEFALRNKDFKDDMIEIIKETSQRHGIQL